MSLANHYPVARAAEADLVSRHQGGAIHVASANVDARIAANDVQGALDMDRIRREVVELLNG